MSQRWKPWFPEKIWGLAGGHSQLVPNDPAHAREAASRDRVGVLKPPAGTVACVIAIEDAPVRTTFDGKEPTQSGYGLLLRRGDHSFFPISADMRIKFMHADPEASEERTAHVSVLWLQTAGRARRRR